MSKELVIQKEISPVLNKVNNLSITSVEDMAPATELLSKINKFADNMKKDRLALTTPIEESLKLIRAKYAPTEKLLKEAIDSIKNKMATYQQEALRLQKIEEEKIAARVSKGTLKIETAVRKMGEIDAPESKVKTDAGSVGFREDKDFEVIDISKLPLEYLLSNDVLIRKAMKEGKEIPGCKYFMKMIITNRR